MGYRERYLGARRQGLVFRDAVNPSMGARTPAVQAGDALQTSPCLLLLTFMLLGEKRFHERYREKHMSGSRGVVVRLSAGVPDKVA